MTITNHLFWVIVTISTVCYFIGVAILNFIFTTNNDKWIKSVKEFIKNY